MGRQRSVIFEAPKTIRIEETAQPVPGPSEVLVRTLVSAISPGTEMLFYRGQIPEGMAVDATIDGLGGEFGYPLSYGYALVGEVVALGTRAAEAWLGRRVFLFAPHQSYVVSRPENLLPLPVDLSAEQAVLLPFMETAVSFLMDAQPMIGEDVVVFGQGIIGLLATTLLADYPLGRLLTVDPLPLRRDWSLRKGAQEVFDPQAPDFEQRLASALEEGSSYSGADLVFELSGRPHVLDQAIRCCGFDGRLLVGSWYGSKTAPVDLGGHFHRSQIKLISSQVSHIAPRWRGRFDTQRRMQCAWAMLKKHGPQSLITQRIPIAEAARAYRLLDEAADTAVQVILDYSD